MCDTWINTAHEHYARDICGVWSFCSHLADQSSCPWETTGAVPRVQIFARLVAALHSVTRCVSEVRACHLLNNTKGWNNLWRECSRHVKKKTTTQCLVFHVIHSRRVDANIDNCSRCEVVVFWGCLAFCPMICHNPLQESKKVQTVDDAQIYFKCTRGEASNPSAHRIKLVFPKTNTTKR